MVGNKLDLIIAPYIGIPYWRNKLLPDGTIEKEGPFGGKGTIAEINYATACARELEQGNLSQTDLEIQKKYNIGLECSGLVYNVLDDLARALGHAGIYFRLIGEWRGIKRHGSRAVSALHMALPVNSLKINLEDILPGDLIIMVGKDGMGHVMIVTQKSASRITVLHNSSESYNNCVHNFNINITNPNSDIFQQTWDEITSTNKDFRTIFDLHNPISGIYRPHFLCQK